MTTADTLAVPVSLDHLDDVLTVLDDAAHWLVKRGVEQWPVSFRQSPVRCRKIAHEIMLGHVFVHYDGDIPTGTVTVTDWQDPDFRDGWPEPDLHALYVTRLAVTRTARDREPGLGARLLEFAADHARRAGYEAVRLDCNRLNRALHGYYERQGFAKVGRVCKPPRKSGALFERRL